MPTRGKTTFQKRQKEAARRDKQQRKAARRVQRKLDGPMTDQEITTEVDSNAEVDANTESEVDANVEPPEQ
jgi:hypothetical protein